MYGFITESNKLHSQIIQVKIYTDCIVPELIQLQYERDDLERDFPDCLLRSDEFYSPLNRLRRYIGQYHIFGCIKPKTFQRELLISATRRSERSREERTAKNFLSSCIRSVLADLSHVEINDEIEDSIKYGELLLESIRQVFLLNPTLNQELDTDLVRNAIFKRASVVIRAYKRGNAPSTSVLHDTITSIDTTQQSSTMESKMESDDEHCQEVPEVIILDD
ncbi:uncharacterized protein LOC126815512 isoform X2 [Patella vulgata]|uniref:uncharacterized protein LOC126815512 isoform X2 n=1 Tax=Patella vulgata TaxID=6465 RepID=UPI0024A837C0|nr:uncharacterized protein LOC126815512 isoform X2 [Patella vulgata]